MSADDRKSLGKAGLTLAEVFAKAAIRSEKQLHQLIEQDLSRRNVPYYHSRTDKRATISRGLPDFAFAFEGVPVAVECKLAGEQLTAEQELTLEKMRLCGWKVFVIHDFDEYMDALQHARELAKTRKD
jgi:hypothetical protein